MAHFAVSAVGSDRPGIVAAIASALLQVDGNLEDSRMTILRGHFSVMLIVSVPDGAERSALEGLLHPVREQLGLEALTVSPVDELKAETPTPSHVITVYGADHTGIVQAISSALAGIEVNITDLQTKLTGPPDSLIYVMLLEVDLGGRDPDQVESVLAPVAEQAAVEVSIGELSGEAL